MFCFVILHYMTVDETEKCVASIFKNVSNPKKIIIVDNGSKNSSFSQLQQKYQFFDDVDVICSKENIGFAKGNNLGYEYALKNYNPDFMIVMNNDVELCDSDFCEKVISIYEKEKFGILSPDIYSTFSKVHQSPKRLTSYSYDEVQKLVKKYRFRQNSKILIPVKCFLKEIKFLKKIMQFLKFKKKGINYQKVHYNVPLHGACFIFSRQFINRRKKCFFDGTFMYFESEILDYECHRDGIKTMYNPSIRVYHHHSISSSRSYHSELSREKFVNNCVLDSLKSFANLMESDLNEK